MWRSAFFALLVWAPFSAFAIGDAREDAAPPAEQPVVKHPTWKLDLGTWAPQLRWPLATRSVVTSPFGGRVHPIEGIFRQHAGVDLSAEPGQPVQAAAPGRVIRAGWRGGHGYQVEVLHAGGLHTCYSHLSQLLVELGAMVEAGSALGLAGDTGLATGVHLHFEVWRKGHAKNPLRWFRRHSGTPRPYVLRQRQRLLLSSLAGRNPMVR